MCPFCKITQRAHNYRSRTAASGTHFIPTHTNTQAAHRRAAEHEAARNAALTRLSELQAAEARLSDRRGAAEAAARQGECLSVCVGQGVSRSLCVCVWGGVLRRMGKPEMTCPPTQAQR